MAGPEGPAIVVYGESALCTASRPAGTTKPKRVPPGGQGPRIVRVGRGGVHPPSAGLRATREYVPDDERLRRDRPPRPASSTKTSC